METCKSCRRNIKNISRHRCSKCQECDRYFACIKKHRCLFNKCKKCSQKYLKTKEHNCKKLEYNCVKCQYQTTIRQEFLEHRRNGHVFSCPECSFESSTHRIMSKHFFDEHNNSKNTGYHCPYCSFSFNQKEHFNDHILTHSNNDDLPLYESAFKKTCTSFGSRFKQYKYKCIDKLFDKFSSQIKSIIINNLQINKSLKYTIIIIATLDKYDNAENKLITRNEFVFRSNSIQLSIVNNDRDIQSTIDKVEQDCFEQFDDYCNLEGSGWIFQYVNALFVEVAACGNLTGGNPIQLFNSKNTWDGICDEGECFYTAVTRHFYKFGSKTDSEIQILAREKFPECRNKIPMAVGEIKKFEKKYNLPINVIYFEDSELYAIKRSELECDKRPINILLKVDKLYNGNGDFDKYYHYVYILNLDNLLGELNYIKQKQGYGKQNPRYPCINCLNFFSTHESRRNHQVQCFKKKIQTIEFPEPHERKLKFSRHDASHLAPLIGAFDFEMKMDEGIGSTTHSQNINNHKVVSYSLVIINHNNEIIFSSSQQDENNVLDLFLETLSQAESLIKQMMARTQPMNLTKTEEIEFNNQLLCHICNKPFKQNKDVKVRDHCHFTGKFLGGAHQDCNLRRKNRYKVPIYAHNFSGYDSHFLFQAIAQSENHISELKAMAYNTEKFRTISVETFSFLDSMHFISDSLNNIVNDLTKSNHQFPILKNSGLYSNNFQRSLLLKKGIFPYELLTSLDRFSKMTVFPPIESFYSKLTESGISQEDYIHGKTVFESFKMKNMEEYLKLYNELDVYLLLEAITAFRQIGWKEFKLDPAYFISLPQYGFQW